MRQWLWGVFILGLLGLAACGSAPGSAAPASGPPTATMLIQPTQPPATPAPPTAPATQTTAPPTATVVPSATAQSSPATTSAAKTVSARLGRDVAMHIGDTAAVEGEGVTVEFVSVVEDSRCPVGVQCVRAGRVVVAVRVSRAGQAGEEINLASDPKDASAKTVNGYTVALVNVQPAKTVPGPSPSEYVITVVVTKG